MELTLSIFNRTYPTSAQQVPRDHARFQTFNVRLIFLPNHATRRSE